MILEDAYTASSLLQAAIGAKRDHTDLCVNSCLVILAPKQSGGVVYCGYGPLFLEWFRIVCKSPSRLHRFLTSRLFHHPDF